MEYTVEPNCNTDENGKNIGTGCVLPFKGLEATCNRLQEQVDLIQLPPKYKWVRAGLDVLPERHCLWNITLKPLRDKQNESTYCFCIKLYSPGTQASLNSTKATTYTISVSSKGWESCCATRLDPTLIMLLLELLFELMFTIVAMWEVCRQAWNNCHWLQ